MVDRMASHAPHSNHTHPGTYSLSLRTYIRKRDFARTSEPQHKPRRKSRGYRFVVQQHDASHMHFDFRLEFGGVLKSWAIPKGPSMNPADKRLAVQVEDHPVAYADFEGVIPKSAYGGGNVIIWDEGTWTPITPPKKAIQEGRLKFTLHGQRLQGEWALVRLAKSPKHWLLIKHHDKAAQTGRAITERFTRSIRSHQQVQDVSDATARPLPRQVAPALATLVPQVPEGPGWLFEIKWDGYRAMATREHQNVEIRSRNGRDWTSAMASVAEACRALPCEQMVIDGEVVVLDRRSISRFGMLQEALSQNHQAALRYIVFDLLYLNGHDIRGQPLLARKRLLEALVQASSEAVRQRITYSAHTREGGAQLLQATERAGMEGILAKREASVYQSRRTRDWLKIKCVQQGDFLVGGWTPASPGTRGLGTLLLGTPRRSRPFDLPRTRRDRFQSGRSAAHFWRSSSLGAATPALLRGLCQSIAKCTSLRPGFLYASPTPSRPRAARCATPPISDCKKPPATDRHPNS